MTTTITLTADEMATILAALRVAKADAHERLFAARDRDACLEVQHFIGAEITAARSVIRHLQSERQAQHAPHLDPTTWRPAQ